MYGFAIAYGNTRHTARIPVRHQISRAHTALPADMARNYTNNFTQRYIHIWRDSYT